MKLMKLSSIILLLAFYMQAGAQTTKPLFTVGNENIGVDEFLNVYKKNNMGKEIDYSENAVRDYLNLYINFREKVKEARDMKMDTSTSVNNELSTYRSTLAKSYLIDKEVTDLLVNEAYNRLGKEVHVEHILVKCDQNAAPADTLKAYLKAMTIYNLLVKGKDFNKMAKDSSGDPSAKDNGGDLGYITALQVVYPFENAAYNTPVGKMSKPIRTRFGYHIVKVLDVRTSRGTIQVEHIFVKLTKSATHDDSLKAKSKIDQIYQRLTEGESFEDIAKAESEDKTSSGEGGKLPAFGTGKMVPDFENAAFALKNVGDYSKPILSKYGWHIIKLIDKVQTPSLDAYRETLRKQVEKDSRSEVAKTSYINKAKIKFNFSENNASKTELFSKMDSSLMKGLWKADQAAGLNKVLFSLTDNNLKPEVKNYTQADLADFIEKNQRKNMMPNDRAIMFGKMYNSFVENSLISFQEQRLDREYPAFADLMKEYMDGILLFELTDQKVWSKAVKDTTGLRSFYAATKEKYPDEEKISIKTYNLKDGASSAAFNKLLAKGMDDNAIKLKLNKKDSTAFSFETNTYKRSQFENENSGLEWKIGSSKTNNGDNGAVEILKVINLMPVMPKPLEEARGYVVADFQEKLEKDWIQSLREKYPVHINEDVLSSIIKK